MKLFFFLLLTAFLAHAQSESDISHLPKSFAYGKGKAVFVDFQEVTYYLNYDINAKEAKVKATFKMSIIEEGYPIFDLIEEPSSVTIDGIKVQSRKLSTPSKETTVRVIDKQLVPGNYELEIEAPLLALIEYTDTGVKSAFWVTDLEDRFYLERYIPSNLEYDRMKMTFEINFKGLKSPQHLFANGKVTWLDTEKARIEFPSHFTVNSLYFHTTPVGSVSLDQFFFTSKNGRELPVTIYTANGTNAARILTNFKTQTLKVLSELENDYGAFPHQSVTIYNANLSSMGLGGMEYAGATVTNLRALGHELFHSYFARGIVPANGNAGWIDESLASWRDDGYDRISSLKGTSGMAAHPEYTRKTDTAAYNFGSRFMAFLDGKFADKGGLKPFMNKLLENKLFTPIFAEEFIHEMEEFYGESLNATFNKYVYAKNPNLGKNMKTHPVHQKMNPLKMKGLL